MRLGLLVRAENIGLGAQTWELYRHLNPYKTMIVDLSQMNGTRAFPERFPGAITQKTIPSRIGIMNWLQKLDTVFTCETPYNYELFSQARKRGIRTVLQYNYEFLDYLQYPKYPMPSVLLSPSLWHFKECQARFNAYYMPVPVNRSVLPFERKKQFKEFLHLAGIRVDHDRNGTEDTMQAVSLLPHVNLTVRCQNAAWVDQWRKAYNFPNIKIESHNCDNYYENYNGFDALIFPRKYGGLCLPMQEALSKGMPVLMTDIEPNNQILPQEWLCPASHISNFTSRATNIEIYSADIANLAERIDRLAKMSEVEAGAESDKADAIAQSLSWDVWKDKYLKFLNELPLFGMHRVQRA